MAQASGNSSRRNTGVHNHDSGLNHWHDKQDLMQRELEEARARASQMEKTMRWWSDCTANWREKWSKVRTERNKAREEVRLLRSRLETSQREFNILHRQKFELEAKLSQHGQGIYSRHSQDICSKLKEVDKHCNEVHNSTDSPERDGSNISQRDSAIYSNEPYNILDDKDSTSSLLNEVMMNCNLGKGVENVSVYLHSPNDASRLSEKCRSNRTKSDDTMPNDDLFPSEKDFYHGDSTKEYDIEENIQKRRNLPNQSSHSIESYPNQSHSIENFPNQSPHSIENLNNQSAHSIETALIESGSNNSSNQISPSHRISVLSDPLPEACHISPRISAISDPLSELCASECSETGYAESIRSSDGLIGRRWRTGERGQSGVSSSILDDSGITPEQESLEQQVTMLKLRLEEASKTIQVERDEKLALDREKCKQQSEIAELRSRLDDVRISRQEAVKELVSLRDLHQKQLQTLQLEMLDEASSREYIDRRLADLRGELERLQEENAAEWGRRERLETEKLNLERENKKLRSQIEDLEDRFNKRNKMVSSTCEADVAMMKEELAEKIKELAELKHAHSKLKKILSDKSTELQHSNKRGDQYESEVERLRARVDELKKELAAAEDEVDSASNTIRKLHRTNDELQENVENLQVQVEHLQSRLRSSQSSMPSLSLMRDSDEE